jgi:hypothetical protein
VISSHKKASTPESRFDEKIFSTKSLILADVSIFPCPLLKIVAKRFPTF